MNAILAIPVPCWWCKAPVYHKARVVNYEHNGYQCTRIEVKTDAGWISSNGATCSCKECESKILKESHDLESD